MPEKTRIAYTAGYRGQRLEDLATAARRENAIVVDIRHSPNTPNLWAKSRLCAFLEQSQVCYKHCPQLGNRNYNKPDQPIEIVSLHSGIILLESLIAGDQRIILLCACEEYDTCHRRTVAEALRERGWHTRELSWSGFPIFTVYENPRDYPGKFVVRRSFVGGGSAKALPDPDPLIVADSLEAARGAIPRSTVTRWDRHPEDEPQIIEAWL